HHNPLVGWLQAALASPARMMLRGRAWPVRGPILRGGIPDPVEPLGARRRTGLRPGGVARPSLALLGVALSAGLLAGCASLWGKTEIVETTDLPDVIYGKADTMINKGSYADAAKEYEQVDINHPSSQEARKAIVMAGDADYKG